MPAVTTYLITGASSGIGLELVKQLVAADNNRVFATVRKRAGSLTGVDDISRIAVSTANGSSVTVLEGIDVADDGVGASLLAGLGGTAVDVVVHNAGSLSGTRDVDGASLMTEQKFGAVAMERMRAAFEVNALGPLRVQQALVGAGLMGTSGDPAAGGAPGKVVVISTGMGSIGENTSGGVYAYRASKAAVNMIAKSMSSDLKEKGISVRSIAPGMVATEFGPGKEKMAGWGAMPVDVSCRGILSLVGSMTMENTGEFHCVKKDGPTKVMPW